MFRNIFSKFSKNPVEKKDKEVVQKLVEQGKEHLEELKKIDQRILTVQKSTKTTFSFFAPIHNYCRTQYTWYYDWHIKPYATKIHTGVLTLVLLSSLGIASSSILSFPNTGKANIDFAPDVAEKMVDYTKIYASIPADSTELPEKRTQNQKVFRRPDGQQQYIISGGPLHYKNSKGKWQNIDSSILPKEDGSGFSMSQSIYVADFSKQFTADPLLSIKKDSQTLSMKPGELSFTNATENQAISSPLQVEGTADSHQVLYKDAYGPGLDFAYETQDLKLNKKLNINSFESLPAPTIDTTDEANSNIKLDLQFGLDSGLDLFIDNEPWDGTQTTIENQNIVFKKDGKVVWQLTPAKAWDASYSSSDSEKSAIDSSLPIESGSNNIITGKSVIAITDGKLDMSLLFPYSWLKTAQYPVTLDPATVYANSDDGNITGWDISTYAAAHDTSTSNDSASSSFFVGQDKPFPYLVSRGFVRFDTSAIEDSATVGQANMHLTLTDDSSATDFDIDIYKTDWTSTLASNQEADYDASHDSTKDATLRNTSGISINTDYGSGNLDTTRINTTGYTYYSIRSSRDASATEVSGSEMVSIASQDNTTAAYRPYLSVITTTSDFTWDGGGDGTSWSDPLNWDKDSGYPDTNDDKAIINTGSASISTPVGGALIVGEVELGASYSGTLTLGNNIDIDNSGGASGALTITHTSAILYNNGKNLIVDGTVSNTGTIKMSGDEATVTMTNDTDSGTVEYTATSSSRDIKNLTYYNLKINGTGGTFKLPADTNVNGNLDVTAGTLNTKSTASVDKNLTVLGSVTIAGTLTANSSTISVGGSWTTNGTFTYGTSTVIATGTGTWNAVSSAKPFYKLQINSSGTVTISYSYTKTYILQLTAGAVTGGGFIVETNTTSDNIYINDGLTITSSTTMIYMNLYATSAGTPALIPGGNYPHLLFTANTGGSSGSRNDRYVKMTGNITVGNASSASSLDLTNAVQSYGRSNLETNGYDLTVWGASYIGEYANHRNGYLNITGDSVVDLKGNVTILASDGVLPDGISTSADSSLTFGGNLANGDILDTSAGGTIYFNKASGTQTLNSGGDSFNHLTHSGAGTLQLVTSDLDVNGTFTNEADGIFDANNLNMSFAGNWNNTTGGTFTRGSGTLTFDGTSTIINSSVNAASLGTLTITGTATLGSWLTIGSATGAGTLNLGSSQKLIISGTGTPLTVTTFEKGTDSTVQYTGNDSTTVAAVSYHNLEILPSANSKTFTLASGTIACSGNITMGNGTNTSVMITAQTNNTILDIDGNLTVSANTSFTPGNTAAINIGGNWTINGTYVFTPTTTLNTVTFDGTASGKTIKTNYAGGASQDGKFHNLTINGSGGVWTIVDTDLYTFASGTLAVTDGTLNLAGRNINSGDIDVNGGTLTGTTGALYSLGSFNITDAGSSFVAPANVDIYGTTFAIGSGADATNTDWETNSSSLTCYDNDLTLPIDTYYDLSFGSNFPAANFTLGAGSTTVKNDLDLSTSGGAVALITGDGSNTLNVEGDITIAASTSITSAGSTINLAGNWTNNGGFTPGTGTVNFNKSSDTQILNSGGNGIGNSFNNLTHSGAGTLQLSTHPISLDGNFENSAGIFDANGLNVNVAKNWTISGGSFSAGATPGTQTVTLDSTNASIVSGSTTFNNLTLNTASESAGKTISFASGSTQTVSGTTTLAGASGKVLTLERNGGVVGDHWNLAIAGDMTSGQFISVSDNNVTGGIITPGSWDLTNVVDGGNNSGWNFDHTAPTGSINISGEYTKAIDVTLTLSATDSQSNLGTMAFSNDNVTYSAFEPYGTSKNWTLSAGEGAKTVYVKYKDNSANESSVYSASITYDGTAPVITSTTPTTTSPTNSLTVKFDWNAATDTVSGLSKYYVFIGTTPTGTDVVNNIETTETSYTKIFDSGGVYYARIKAEDVAGNLSDFSLAGSVVIESESPELTIDNITTQYITTKTFTIQGTVSDKVGPIASVQIKIDDGAYVDAILSGSAWSYNWANYTEGGHSISVKALDAAGNTKETSTYAVTVDTVAPTQASDFRLFNVSNVPASVYATYLDFAGSTDDTSGMKSYEIWKNGSKLFDVPMAKEASNQFYTGNNNQPYYLIDSPLSSGKYTYKVKAIDNAGNISETPDLTVDTAGKTIETDSITEAKGTASSVVTKSKTSAIITWKTVYPATSYVEYGESTNYGNKTEIDTNMNQGHSVLLSDLKPATTYHAKVKSRDIYGKELESPDFTFTTKEPPQDTNIIKVIINALQSLFRAITVGAVDQQTSGSASQLVSGTATADQLSALQGFSNNLLLTDISFKEKGYFGNVLAFEKGKKIEKSTDDKNYSTLSSSNSYYFDKETKEGVSYYYRLDGGNPINRKPVLGDDSALSINEPQVIKESVQASKDSAQLTVSWTTNRGSSSQVEFGLSTSYGQKTKEDVSLNMGHNVILEGLSPDTTYHFKVTSKDAKGNVATSEDFTFQTPSAQKDKTAIDVIFESFQRVWNSVTGIF